MYFEKAGKENTIKTLELALETARNRNIKHIVLASSSGETASLLSDVKDINIICVTHAYGFKNGGENDMSDDVRKNLIKKGVKVLSTTHVLSGAERGISKKFGGVSPVELIAATLRMFGQGTKVAVEVAIMAADSGLIPYMEPIISIGGTHYGADTAIILKPNHANNILDTKIEEIICKPNSI
ncbi:pyruvate kinase alpha/beta domain-containing protein [Clostridium senegalense]|uniref:pyruvate kinase alpha/beta domain-containing protein n=1 Tax=Clostridium senegalense TaxID=1465809 RepID=UPI001C0F3F9C|nr:pyruvate kinase alpha/beta domain-containing protein [Clostridium senegalense]MBU5227669.1 hypothetical protein [Clostridium senegalense]